MSVLMETLGKIMTESVKAGELANIEVANRLIEKVWPKFDISSEESALLDTAIERLRNGEVVPQSSTPPANAGHNCGNDGSNPSPATKLP